MSVGFLDAMNADEFMGASFKGDSWSPWRAAMGGAFGERLTEEQAATFERLSGGRKPLSGVIARELWIAAGRRGGKTNVIAGTGVYLGTIHVEQAGLLDKLSPGETGVIAKIAMTRDQATVLFNYALGIMEASPVLSKMIRKAGNGVIELTNGVRLEVFPNNFRSVRGRTLLAAILDECAFYRDDSSALPDVETYRALKPALATTGGPLIGISSPYAKKGLLYDKWRKHYGIDGDILVLQGGTRDFNPTISQAYIDEQLADDPEGNKAEYLAQFRSDISSFIQREVIEACVSTGVHERGRLDGIRYHGFCDPSGGSKDSMTLAIGHSEDGRIVVDCIREALPPFSPEAVTKEFSDTFKSYRITRIEGDRFAGEWPREQFRKFGIEYSASARPKSALYQDLLPKLNSGEIDLLDNSKLVNQLCNLERRTARGGRDSIDHPPHSHDDVCNSVAGLASLLAKPAPPTALFGTYGNCPDDGVRRGYYMIEGEGSSLCGSQGSPEPEYENWQLSDGFTFVRQRKR